MSVSEHVKQRAFTLPPTLAPRGLRRTEAAAYLGVSVSLFDDMIHEGVMPKPLRFGGRVFWDRHAIDRALDQMMAAQIDTGKSAGEWNL